MSETSDDKLTESVLDFYNQLTDETCSRVKNSRSSTLLVPCKPSRYLKVDPSSVNLNKTLQKVKQKTTDRQKAIRKKKKKANLNVTGRSVCETSVTTDRQKAIRKKKKKANPNATGRSVCKKRSVTEELQKSNVDLISPRENESTCVSINSYGDVLKGMEDLLSTNCEPEKLYISCKPQDDDSLLVALLPNTKIYLIGYYALKLILGNISVLGYKFKQNEMQVIYSPASHSLLSINCHDGCEVKKLENQKIKDLCIPLEYVQDLSISTDQPVVLVKVYRYCSNITQIFDESYVTGKKYKLEMCMWKETLDVQLVEDTNECRVPLLCEPKEWTSYLKEVQHHVESRDKGIFVITGGKSVGKSTFLKYIINSFLSICEVPGVACIDVDPGQPEFSLAGCLTLSVCSLPLLGPSFSHHENYVYSYQKQILFGDISVNHMMNEYLQIVSYLFSLYKEKFSDLPLVMNTMGYTTDTGYDIMIDILRILEPTHVISLHSSHNNKNYPTLAAEIVSSINRGTLRNNFKDLKYNLVTFDSVSKETSKTKSKISKEINIMGYLSLLWKKNEKNLTCYTFKKPLTINYRNVAIHIHRSFVSQSHVLLAINGSLVALCNIGREFLYQVNPQHPLQIRYDISSLLSCECLGWGVVRGVDPISKEISIYTPLDLTDLRKVNVVAMPNVQLPIYFRNYFSNVSGNPPYIKNR